MNIESLDTSDEARRVQENSHRQMGPEGRLRLACELSEVARRMRLAGLRREMPDAGESERIRAYIAEVHGVELEPRT